MTVRADYVLYAATVFVSSFLLFAVQPLLGKHITPWFGGTASVWITAMAFFMVVLALGYLYALALSLCSRAVAVTVHVSILLLSGAVLLVHAGNWPSAITPLLEHVPVSVTERPVMAVWLTLTLAVGVPFLLLSSTSSLLQYWYGATTGREPFSLYAVSNAGSLLGLLAYPALLEPFLSTHGQGAVWSVGFALYGVLLVGVAAQAIRARDAPGAVVPAPAAQTVAPPPVTRMLAWAVLAAVPVATMLTATSYVSGYIVSMPFLWIIPLSLYLTSFIVSFRSGPRLPHSVAYAFSAVFATAALVVLVTNQTVVLFTLVVAFVALFAVCHPCHETLYRLRPAALHLPRFYLALSLGGILGSTLVLVSSLYWLPVPIEFSLLVAVAAVVSSYFVIFASTYTRALARYRPRLLFSSLALLIGGSLGVLLYKGTIDVIAVERNFFGYKAVRERAEGDLGSRRMLVHGTTDHGYEFRGAGLEGIPFAYHGATSGVAKAFAALRPNDGVRLRVAVAGLGSGVLAGLCRSGDRFDFFEIDPEVITLAKQYFTFLGRCAGAEVQLGDARLALQRQYDDGVRRRYDLIVLDAYADDMMPIHLMTAEAFAVYKELLADDGLLALHISSRYLDLGGVAAGLARANGLIGRYHFDTDPPAQARASNWTLFAKREELFLAPPLAGLPPLADFEPRFWTDTYSALLPVVKLW
jgi:hypothetical protein